ncbi:MAG: hypothetical protein ACI9QL_004976 [Candidatus Omnitrophota bacterium]|jgi:hypothetical protein
MKPEENKKETGLSKGLSDVTPPRHAIEAEFESVKSGTEVRPGVISPGGDIIIRLQQVELNQRLDEVANQTQRANDISDQIGNAFNKMADQYEAGWEVSRKDAEGVRDSVTVLEKSIEQRIENQEQRLKTTFDELGEHIRTLHSDLDKQNNQLKGGAEYASEQSAKQQKLLLILIIVAIAMSAASVVLQLI